MVDADFLRAGDAHLIVDVQCGFCPGGSLPIPLGDSMVPTLNRWIDRTGGAGIPIYASRDWHPRDHMSFKERDGQWPVHCVQSTPGAAFHAALRLPAAQCR